MHGRRTPLHQHSQVSGCVASAWRVLPLSHT